MGKFFNIDDESKILSLYIKVKTGAKANSFNSFPDSTYVLDGREYLKMNIKSPPVEGKANNMIIAYLSDLLKIPKAQIEITSGHRSKFKSILVKTHGILKEEMIDLLNDLYE